MRTGSAWAVVLIVLLSTFGARGESSKLRVRLVYERIGPEAGSCPPPEALVIAIRERLGYDPTDFSAKEVLRVEVSAKRSRRRAASTKRLVSRIVWLAENGESLGERVLSDAVGRCDALIANTGLAVALALDPQAVEAVQAGAKRIERPRRAAARTWAPRGRRIALESPPPPRPAGAVDREEALSVRLGVGLMATFGLEAHPAGLGGAVELGLGVGAWSGYLRLHLSGIWTQRVDAEVRYRLMTPLVELGGCYGVSVVDVCALAAVGVSVAVGHGGGSVETTRSGVTGLAGLRAVARVAVDGPVTPTFELTVAAPFARTVVVVADREVFRSWPVIVTAGIGLRAVVF